MTTLTAVMIGGLLILITLVVIRVQQPAPGLAVPEQVALPDGTRATAFTATSDWYAVVTDDNQILIFDRDTGALTQTIDVK